MNVDIIKVNKETILEIIRNRENKAITKLIFNIDNNDKRLASCVGRTLTGIYVDDYRKFINGDIVTEVSVLNGGQLRYFSVKVSKNLVSVNIKSVPVRELSVSDC